MESVIHYHETTKHFPHRSARSLGYLDWATQPDPFRRFRDAPLVPLLLTGVDEPPPYDALYEPPASSPRPVNLESISAFFQFSMALSAWKEYGGSRWALRINPSSGNLHPTEGYLVIGAAEGVSDSPGVFHYAPKDHLLERRCEIPSEVWDELIGGFPRSTFLAGLSSVHWREAWKYGERAYRYCQHDVGHATAALALSAALRGWQAQPLTAMGDDRIGALLGLDRGEDFEHAECEHPDLIIAVIPSGASTTGDPPRGLPSDAIERVSHCTWYGRANRLSSDHVEWSLIDSAANACRKPSAAGLNVSTPTSEFAEPFVAQRTPASAREIIQQRRSAVALDGYTSLTDEQFYLMMDRLLPRFECPPWKALGPPAYVHLGLFVHRVEGLEPGLYCLVRSPGERSRLQDAMRDDFTWQQPAGCPQSLPLYHLLSADVRAVAGQVSCGQDIAAMGAFSVGMIANFEQPLRTCGSWIYRRLFWETGMIGQVLYLEAEAAGLRGTGIGCFFDDSVHDLFGLAGRTFQSLYHFTVGGPVEDTRLTTSPPYPPEITGRTTTAD